MKRKVCLVGEEAVGKTSLVRRFVTAVFDESYVRTLGAVVWKKSVELTREVPARVDLVILDIVGKRTFMQLFREAYFHHAAGILAVFDLTKPETLRDLRRWTDAVVETVGRIPLVAVGNKMDLRERLAVSTSDVLAELGPAAIHYFQTSAKTGERVEEAFFRLAELVGASAVGSS